MNLKNMTQLKTNQSLHPHWNGQRCQARVGTVVVGASLRPTWWCAGLEGQRHPCVRVDYLGDVFYLDDTDGRGRRKVWEQDGSPWVSHRSLPVDDDSSFVASHEPDPA